jgi:hypothetical protein
MVSFNLSDPQVALTKRSATELRAAECALMMINFDNLLTKKSECSALSPQARLLLGLLIHGSMQMKEALMYTPLSYRAFYVMITKLKASSLVDVEGGFSDRRIRCLSLGRRFTPMTEQLAESLEEMRAINSAA